MYVFCCIFVVLVVSVVMLSAYENSVFCFGCTVGSKVVFSVLFLVIAFLLCCLLPLFNEVGMFCVCVLSFFFLKTQD